MKVNDFFVGLFFAVLGSYVCWYASTLPTPRHVNYGAGLFPSIIGTGLILVGAIIGLKAIPTLRRGNLGERPAWMDDLRLAARFWSIPASVPFYVLTVDSLGFLLTSILIMVAMLMVRGVRFWRSLTVAVGMSLVLTLLFGSFLKVPLPWGPLTNVSGYLMW